MKVAQWAEIRRLSEIEGLMHHGEPILIQGDSYRMKDKGNE